MNYQLCKEARIGIGDENEKGDMVRVLIENNDKECVKSNAAATWSQPRFCFLDSFSSSFRESHPCFFSFYHYPRFF